MKKQVIYSAFLLLAMGAFVTSCGDDGVKGGGGNGSIDDDGKGSMEVMSPTDTKSFLSETGSDFMDRFKAADQKDVIELVDYFIDKYGDLEAPDAFDIEEFYYGTDRKPAMTPTEIMKSLRRLAAQADISSLSRAMYNYTYDINFDRFKGIYEPGRYEWVRSGDSKDIVFLFNGPKGEPCEAKLAASGSASNFEYTYTDDYYSEESTYKFSIPQIMVFTLTQNGRSRAHVKVDTNIDYNGHKYSAGIDCFVANIGVNVTTNGNDNKIQENALLSVDGYDLLYAIAELEGSNLCNVDRIQNSLEDDIDDGNLTKWFKKAKAKVDVMGKVQAYADVTINNSFVDIDDYWDSWDYDTKEEALKDAQRVANVFTHNIDAKIRYNGTATDQALIRFEPRLNEWGYYGWEYVVEPILYFPQDESTYYFDDYFEKGFRSLTNQWENLIRSYERLWD